MRITPAARRALKARASIDDYPCCEICGRPGANNAHHRRNQSQQGSNRLSSLLLLCGSGTTLCHGRVTGNPDWAEEHGYTIKGEKTDPAKVPVMYRGVRVLLDDGGGVERDEVAA